MFWRSQKKPSDAAAIERLSQRVDTIESNAARDSVEAKAGARGDLAGISARMDRLNSSMESGFKLIGESLLVNLQRLEQRQADYEFRTDQRLAALEARKETIP